jgi:hypothetical protein
MTVKASVSLKIEQNRLVYAGRGYQPDADFARGQIIGEEQLPSSDNYLQVTTKDGKSYFVDHANVQEV